MNPSTYAPGGDAQAIADIARRRFGGFEEMFRLHGWPERGPDIMRKVRMRVVETYGSVVDFEKAFHTESLPIDAILRDQPDVWLTSFYGFGPQDWGLLGFTTERQRQSFISRSEPGALVVVFGASKAPVEMRDMVVGLQQCSHKQDQARDFMSPEAWERHSGDPESASKWNFAVKAIRAWEIADEDRMPVAEFAPETYSKGRARWIGAQGMKLSRREARKLLSLDLREISVFGELPVEPSDPQPATTLFSTSRPGPVSQNPFVVPEAEGPKHLYILTLEGDVGAFLKKPGRGMRIVKAGFSKSPQGRCNAFNSALPGNAFQWRVRHSTGDEGAAPFPTSRHALAGEAAMHVRLNTRGSSLGGEFFAARDEDIIDAWAEGKRAAGAYHD